MVAGSLSGAASRAARFDSMGRPKGTKTTAQALRRHRWSSKLAFVVREVFFSITLLTESIGQINSSESPLGDDFIRKNFGLMFPGHHRV